MTHNTHIIGKVISVSGEKIEVLLVDPDDSQIEFGVPDNMCINVHTDKGPQPLIIGQPGTFIQISLSSSNLLAVITDIQMRESAINAIDYREALQKNVFLSGKPHRIVSTVPIGTLNTKGDFELGTDSLPTVYSDVYAVLPEVVARVFENYAKGDFSIGTLPLLANQKATMNLDNFFTRHAAILGQTGSGKSWTVASFIQKIASKLKQSTIVLLDLHGEYKNVFGKDANHIDARELELPYWLMNFEELIDLMVDRSEHAAPNQIAKFRELLQHYKEHHDENNQLNISKITVDTPVYFDFRKIIEELNRLDTEKVSGTKGEKNGPYYGQFTRLLMRIDSKLNDRRYDLIFQPHKYNTSKSMEELFRKILTEEINDHKKIAVLDISSVPFDVRSSVISLLLRCIFDFTYWHKRVNADTYPIAVFCDEAHIYLNDANASTAAARLSAERIAKEGRKYGISLIVSSQRPREVSATILSQCSTFMCLRITNPDDQAYVRNLLPDSIRGITSLFSSLKRGECILTGDAILMPTRIKIDEPIPAPISNDTSFTDRWNNEHKHLDVNVVLDAWRNQEVIVQQPGQKL